MRAETADRWKDPDYAATWASHDAGSDLLLLPRAISAAVVAADRPDAGIIADVGAGPGAMLEAFLKEMPGLRGIWCDSSEAMLEQAQVRLAPFAGRVSYLLGDMTDLGGTDLPGELDAVVTSRAAHHLDRRGLAGFYTAAAAHLAPGGWLVNLDHVGPPEVWDRRYREVRRRFVAPSPPGSGHHHNYPLPSEADHLAGFAAAGVAEVDVAWKAFYTCLFMGHMAR